MQSGLQDKLQQLTNAVQALPKLERTASDGASQLCEPDASQLDLLWREAISTVTGGSTSDCTPACLCLVLQR